MSAARARKARKEDISLPTVSLKEQAETEKMGINVLNDDCLTHIMQYLPIVDRVRIERVCKRWLAVSRTAWRGFRNLNFSNECWGFSAPESLAIVDHGIIKKILKRCGKFLILIWFSSDFNTTLDPNVLKSVATFCPNIQHLDVWRLFHISPRSWKALCENCNKLVSFAVGGNCTDYGLSLLFENNKELKRLYVFSSNITGECLRKLNSCSIESITLVYCRLLMLDHFHVIRGFRNLKQLALEEFEVNNGFMEDIGSCYKSLKYLTLAYGDADSLDQVAKLINLRILDRSDEPVDDELLVSIGANCKLLKEVDISICNEVTNTGLASIVSLPNLESLFIKGLQNINDQVFHAMPNLRELDCSSCTHMRDAGLIKLIEGSENLEHIYLNDCNISNKLLGAAVKATKKRKNQVMLKLHLHNGEVEQLKTSGASPFLPIFETIIDRSERFYHSELQSYVGSSIF